MDDHAATSLAYRIHRSDDFDAKKPCTVAFCNMGHTIFSVSIVQLVKREYTLIVREAARLVAGP